LILYGCAGNSPGSSNTTVDRPTEDAGTRADATSVVADARHTDADASLPAEASGESSECAVLTGTTGSIVDSAGNVWALVTSTSNGLEIYENGVYSATTMEVTELVYVNHVVSQENVANNWWSWSGTAWTSESDPTTACHDAGLKDAGLKDTGIKDAGLNDASSGQDGSVDLPSIMGSGNFLTGNGTSLNTSQFKALNTAGAGSARFALEPGDYYDDSSSTVLFGADSLIVLAHQYGIRPLLHFEYYTSFTTPLGDYSKWSAIGAAYAQRYAAGSTWLTSQGISDWGVTTYEAINEPDINTPLIDAGAYHEALRGLADGVHSMAASSRVNPGGFATPNASSNFTMNGLGPAIADLWNSGQLDGIDLHTYYDIDYAPIQGTYSYSAAYDFEQIKAQSGITRDINFYSTETNFKNDPTQGITETIAATGLLTGLWDNLGMVHSDGSPAAQVILAWNVFNTTSYDQWYGICTQLDPWLPTLRGQVLEQVTTLTAGMHFVSLAPATTGEYVMQGPGQTLWVWQDLPYWTNHAGTTYDVTGIPTTATKLDVYGWNGLRTTIPLAAQTTYTVTGLPGDETYMFVANAGE
jgi:hypothetical protein